MRSLHVLRNAASGLPRHRAAGAGDPQYEGVFAGGFAAREHPLTKKRPLPHHISDGEGASRVGSLH